MKKLIKKWWVWGIIILLIHTIFKIKAPCEFLVAEWSAGELLTFIGTVSLGYVAYNQNKKANETSDKMADIAEKANDISDRMLKIEEENNTPCIKMFDNQFDTDIKISKIIIDENSVKENEARTINIVVQNISKVDISSFNIRSLDINDKKVQFLNFSSKNSGMNCKLPYLLKLTIPSKNLDLDNEKITFGFVFILNDFFGNKYQQKSEIVFKKIDGDAISSIRSTIENILEYKTEKPVKIQEEEQNEQQ